VLEVASRERLSRARARWRTARGPIVLLAVAGLLFAAGFHRVTASFSGDVSLYEHYAKAAVSSPLFHELPREYPAIATGIFLVPLALPLPYAVGFAMLAVAAGVVLVLSSDGLQEYPGWSRRTCCYLVIGTVAVVFARYDIFPALTAVLAVEGARKDKWGRAWAWAVLGGLLKLFPFLLLPGFLVVERLQTGKWPLRRVGAACISVAVVMVAQIAVAPKSAVSPLRFQLNRGFELSSVQGSLSFLLDPLHVEWIKGFGSIEVVASNHLAISVATTALMVAALVIVWALGYRGQLSVVAVSLAVLSIAVFSEKSFAPQYLVWLAPFWAYWPLRRGWLAAALLTTLVYPVLYVEAQRWGPGFYLPTFVAMVRNVVLIVATVQWLLWQLRLSRATSHETTVALSTHAFPDVLSVPAPSR
jgi:hypothetical protein